MDQLQKYLGCVGPGWHRLLEALDEIMSRTVENAVANATIARPEYREEGNTAEAAVKILQVKEKFGSLRVYIQTVGMSPRFSGYLQGAISVAESLSLQTCEKCGSKNRTETRNKRGAKYGRILTLCGKCHEERDNLPEDQRFELGDGNSTT